MLLVQGGRFGGFSLWLRAGVPCWSYNFAGIDTVTINGGTPLTPGHHLVGVEADSGSAVIRDDVRVTRRRRAGCEHRVAAHVADAVRVLAGEGLCCGYDDGTPVADYAAPNPFTGTLHSVTVDVSGVAYVDVDAEVRRAWLTQ